MLDKMFGSLVVPILFAVVVGVSPVLADEHGSLCSNKGDIESLYQYLRQSQLPYFCWVQDWMF